MREPKIVAPDEWPFDTGVDGAERHRRSDALSGDLFTDTAGQSVIFRGEDDVDRLLRDRRMGAVAMPILQLSGVTHGPLFELWSLLMFGKDGDEHARLRKPIAPEFQPKAIERYRAGIRCSASALLDAAEERGQETIEVWSEYALPLVSLSACEMVGIPADDAAEVGQWSVDLVAGFFLMDKNMRAKTESAATAFVAYLNNLLERKREAPADDIASRLLGIGPGEPIEHDLSDAELVALLANLVFGGLEATAKVITTGVYHLQKESSWSALVEEPALMPTAVSELLRFAPPVGMARYAKEDLVTDDVSLAAGQLAMLTIDAASKDPRKHECPMQLQLDRTPGRQIAFGAGPHFCLGANLAKVILEVAFAELIQRYPAAKLHEEEGEAVWDYDTFHGITHLTLTLRGVSAL